MFIDKNNSKYYFLKKIILDFNDVINWDDNVDYIRFLIIYYYFIENKIYFDKLKRKSVFLAFQDTEEYFNINEILELINESLFINRYNAKYTELSNQTKKDISKNIKKIVLSKLSTNDVLDMINVYWLENEFFICYFLEEVFVRKDYRERRKKGDLFLENKRTIFNKMLTNYMNWSTSISSKRI